MKVRTPEGVWGSGEEFWIPGGLRYLRCLRFRQGALYPGGFEILTLFEVQTESFVPREV